MESEQPIVIARCSNESTGSRTNPKFLANDEFQINGLCEGGIGLIKKDIC